MMTARTISTLFCTALVICAGCTRVPEVEETITPDLKSAKYPELTALTGDLAPLASPSQESEKLEASLAARNARIKKRATALKLATADADDG